MKVGDTGVPKHWIGPDFFAKKGVAHDSGKKDDNWIADTADRVRSCCLWPRNESGSHSDGDSAFGRCGSARSRTPKSPVSRIERRRTSDFIPSLSGVRSDSDRSAGWLHQTYSSILHDPIITVDLIDFQRPYFIVSGQVNKPGQFDLRYDITVTEAVAVAGGFAPTARTQVFLFHRVSTDWVEVKKLKLNDILKGKNVNEDAHLAPGDMIFVPEKAIAKFRKYVPYSIGTSLTSSAFF
jgi:SLBB domain